MKFKNILLHLIQFITRTPRYAPSEYEIDKRHHFDKNIWIVNIFRAWEYIAGRKYGIRKEVSTSYNPQTGQIVVELYTIEALLAHVEVAIREFLKYRLFPFRIYNVQFARAINTPSVQVPWISFAIALDTSAKSTDHTGSPFTWSHTQTGSNMMLVICAGGHDSEAFTFSATYNSVSATLAKQAQKASGANDLTSSIFLLAGAATGSHTVSVSTNQNSSPDYGGVSISYTGANQSSTADATGSNTIGADASGDLTFNVTTIAANCWIATTCVQVTSVANQVPTCDQTGRQSVGFSTNSDGGMAAGDTNGAKAAGSNTVGYTLGAAEIDAATVGASFAPAIVNLSISGAADSTTITESVTLEEVYNINVSDSTTIVDGEPVQIVSFINVSDSTTTAESLTIEEIYNINVSDSTTTLDVLTINTPAVANITGTITPSTDEDSIRTGGKTIIITITGDTWIAAGAASFDLQRQNIINGLTSAQSEVFGWNNTVKALQGVGGVVRTSNTVVTITLDAQITYAITASETITVTVPSTALSGGLQIVATPTFVVNPDYHVNVFDSTTTTESVTLSKTNYINVFDSISVTEGAGLISGIVLYLNYAIQQGSLIKDVSGNNNDSTWEGTLGSQWGSGVVEYGGIFDGSTNYIETPLATPTTGQWSACGWAKPTNFASVITLIGSDAAVTHNMALEITSSTNINFFRNNSLSSHNFTVSLTANQWFFWVLIDDITNNVSYLSINGGALASIANTDVYSNPGNFQIGAWRALHFFLGTQAENGFVNRALTQNEISVLYNSGVGNTYGFGPQLQEVDFISILDSTTITELVDLQKVNFVNAHDSSTLAETLQIVSNQLFINVFERGPVTPTAALLPTIESSLTNPSYSYLNSQIPSYLTPFVDPNFGNVVIRIADATTFNTPGHTFYRHYYSNVQPWNKDESVLALMADFNNAYFLDGSTFELILATSGNHAPVPAFWCISDATLMHCWQLNTQICNYTYSNNTRTVIYDTSGSSGVGHGYSYINGNAQHDISSTDILGFYGYKGATSGAKNGNAYVFYFNFSNSTLPAELDTTVTTEPHWVAVSPSGKYLLLGYSVEGTNLDQGTQVYNISQVDGSISYSGQLTSYSRHSSMGYDISGNEVLVTFIPSGSNYNITSFPLGTPGSGSVVQLNLYLDEAHISMSNTNLPGWCFISMFDDNYVGTGAYAGQQQVFALKLDATGTTLAPYANDHANQDGIYENQPQVVSNRDGSKVIFASAWDTTGGISYAYVTYATQSIIEALTAEEIDFINVSDSTTAIDVVIFSEEIDFINVSDSTTAIDVVIFSEEILEINVSDSTTGDDSNVNLLIPYGQANVSDSITVVEVATLSAPHFVINVSDSTTITESVVFQKNLLINVFETFAIGYLFIFVDGRLAIQIAGQQYIFV